MTIHWNYDEGSNRFIPDRAVTRYHYREVELSLSPGNPPVIVIQNPAHTPGIPGPSPGYLDHEPETVDVFTMFSAEKWVGCSLSAGLPQTFRALDVSFRAEISN
ncbi:hypothetical protein GF318_01520 [Candidatus Micrarchaeota archaeon]|nr:hypothetical protein [Candidatus Micrarchaeota archaeon]